MVQDRAILILADQVVYDLSNGAISNDLERPFPRFQSHTIIWCWISPKR